MFKFPYTFRRENTDYITLPPLKNFAKENNIEDIRSNSHRGEIIDAIEKFANVSQEKEQLVNEWLDTSIRKGKMDILLKKISLTQDDICDLSKADLIEEKLKELLPPKGCRHFATNMYDNTYK